MEAYNWFNKALKHDPNNASAYFGLGRIEAGRNKPQLAADHFAKAVKYEKDPEKRTQIINYIDKTGHGWGGLE
jgi:Tfp pilus assembly protein PilF